MTSSVRNLSRFSLSGSTATVGGAAVPLIAALACVAVAAVVVLSFALTSSESPSRSQDGGDGSASHAHAADPALGQVSKHPAHPAADPRALPSETHPALRAFVNPQTSEASERLPDDFDYQVGQISDKAELAAVAAVLRDRQESDTIRHEAANLLRRSGYADLPSVLMACLQHPDEQERFRSWAVQHLFMVFAEQSPSDADAVRTVIEPLLDDPQPAVRREALLSGHRLGAWPQAEVVATAAEWLGDPHAVDLAVRILRENDARAYLPQVRAILKDADASTPARIAAMVTLGDWEDQHSQDAIAQLASESENQGNQRLHRSARMALERLHAAQDAQERPQAESE